MTIFNSFLYVYQRVIYPDMERQAMWKEGSRSAALKQIEVATGIVMLYFFTNSMGISGS